MIAFTIYISSYFLTVLFFFELIQKPIFILYNKSLDKEPITIKNLCQAYRHGLSSDLVAASYLTAISLLSACVAVCLPLANWLIGWFTTINVFISAILALACVFDTILYKFWRYKLSSSVLNYLHSLKGACASVSTKFLLIALAGLISVWGSAFVALQYLSNSFLHIAYGSTHKLYVPAIAIVMTAILYFFIRGTGKRPNDPTIAYFSSRQLLNHIAANPIFNFIYSLTLKRNFANQFRFYSEAELKKLTGNLFPCEGAAKEKILTDERPNILFIIWESLCERFLADIGGSQGDACPYLARLVKEGILFSNCDSAGIRTDKGLIGVLSGYPAIPTDSIIKYTNKIQNLPALPRRLAEIGYVTTAVHGGDMQRMHKRDFYLTVGHQHIVEQKDFPKNAPKCKWGIHDGYMCEWLFNDIMKKTATRTTWMTTFQTLSSHAPYIVPHTRIAEDNIKNSFSYTDESLGHLIDKLKKSPAWKDMLVVIIGDHGCMDGLTMTRQEFEHVPLLLLGGCIKSPQRIDTIMSQTDIAATLLGQMNLPHNDFPFSRDVLADSYTHPFSFHAYTDGFTLRDNTGFTDYDCMMQKVVEGESKEREERAKAIVQTIYNDLSKR